MGLLLHWELLLGTMAGCAGYFLKAAGFSPAGKGRSSSGECAKKHTGRVQRSALLTHAGPIPAVLGKLRSRSVYA